MSFSWHIYLKVSPTVLLSAKWGSNGVFSQKSMGRLPPSEGSAHGLKSVDGCGRTLAVLTPPLHCYGIVLFLDEFFSAV